MQIYQGGILDSETKDNKEQLSQKLYDQNIAELKKYKLFWDKNLIKDFQTIRYEAVAVNEYEYQIFDCHEQHVRATLDLKSEKQMRYFFSDLSKPFFVENELNEYKLKILFNRVRQK